MPTLSDYIPTSQQFQIFWPCPIRAHVGVPIDFRFSFYEINNQQLTWSLSNAPSWMSINANTGAVSGVAAVEAVHTGIIVSAQRASGLTISKTFTCSVDNSKFIFVSTAGDNGNLGTLASPYRTLAFAITQMNNTVGKTIYVRGGTYIEGYAVQTSPFSGKDRIESDYNEFRGYPGESAYWNFGGGGNGGFDFNIRYGVISNMTIGNSYRLSFPKCLTLSSEYGVLKDTVVQLSDGTAGNNLCGCEIKPQHNTESFTYILVDRCVFHSNYQKSLPITAGNQDNSTGMDLFNNSGSLGGNSDFYIWVLNSKAYNNGYGFKTKHTGNDRMIVQNCESHSNGRGNFHIGGPFLTMRHCVSYNTNAAAKQFVPCSDNGPSGPGWYERNTFVESGTNSMAYVLNFQGNIQSEGGTFKHNITAVTVAPAKNMMRLWEYETVWSAYDINIDRNLYFNTSTGGGFIVGGPAPSGTISFAQWQTKTVVGGKLLDVHSARADPVFGNPSAGNLNITSSSPAATMHEDGTYIGALEPNRAYGTFGLSNTNLINFNVNGAAGGGGPEPEPTSSAGYFGLRKRKGADF